jgi:hypothetical protein
MAHGARRKMIWAAAALLLGMLWTGVSAAQAAAHDSSGAKSGVRSIDNPDGGRIYLGAMAGQLTPQDALGKTLHRVSLLYGDRPQLGRLVQNPSGEIWAGFFTVTAKKQDGKPMAGLALVYAPKSGSAKGAVLVDNADRFPSTVNSMFARLKQELGKAPAASPAAQPSADVSATSTAAAAPATASAPAKATAPAKAAAPVKSAPAQPLQRVAFPDGTGVIGLPAGWQMQKATMGDVTAAGPHGEKLRFGWTIPVIDPTNPQSRTLMPNSRGEAPRNFVAIPFGTDPAKAFTAAFTQLARKAGKQPPDIDISKVQDIPMQGGKNYFFYGNMDFHDGQGKQYLVGQMLNTMPLQMGTWQMTLFVLYGPAQVMGEEGSTIAAIFPSWSRDNNRVNGMANAEMQKTIAETNQFVSTVNQYIDDSDRSTQGMSDMLREETVIVDTRTGEHARTSDALAGALIDANPNRLQAVPQSGYIKGIDY